MTASTAKGYIVAKQVCRKCSAVALDKTTRFVCSVCGTENRESRSSMSERAQTISLRDLRGLSKKHHNLRVVTAPNEGRPKTRGDCVNGPRPCPWVSCRHHLAFEVSQAGGLKEKFPGLELEQLPETCSLDVADDGPLSLEGVAHLMNVMKERGRQIEAAALDSFRRALVLTRDDL